MPGQSYASDEDVSIETNDFRVLTDTTALAAYGTDGTIDPADPWVLRSEGTDFIANAVQPNTIIYLMDENNFGSDPGTSYVVVGPEDAHSIRLRNRGMPAGQGDPPGLPGAFIVGIVYEVRTLAPILAHAANEIDEQFDVPGILAANPGKQLTENDLLILADLNVCKVLQRRYLAVSKGTEVPGAKENFRDKSDAYAKRCDELSSRLTLRFTTSNDVAVSRRQRWSRMIK
jgi:hypothetical protein